MPETPVVILTREKDDNRSLAGRLSGKGLPYVEYPCIKTVPVSPGIIPHLNEIIGQYDTAVFTSRRAVKALEKSGLRFDKGKPRIACVGGSTAEAVQRHLGQKAWLVADPPTAESLALMLVEKCRPVERLIHFRGNKTTGKLKSVLFHHGFHLDEAVVYRHQNQKNEPLRIKGPGIAVLASPSAAAFFLEHNPDLQSKLAFLAIGPTTADYLKNLDLQNVYQTKKPDAGSLLTAIIEIIERHRFPKDADNISSKGGSQ